MTTTREEQQEQQQQQTRQGSRFGPQIDGNGQDFGSDGFVADCLRVAGAAMRRNSGNPDYLRFSNHFDGQEVIYKNKANQIQNNCPVSIADKADWLKKVKMTLSDDGSGIRWMVINQTLPCLVDNANLAFDTHPSLLQYHEFTFDRVIPLAQILSGTREKCTISVLNADNFTYKLMCPARIW